MSKKQVVTEENKGMSIAEKARLAALSSEADNELENGPERTAEDQGEERPAVCTEENSSETTVPERTETGAETENNASAKEPTAEQRIWDEIYDENSIKLELKLGHMDLYTFLMYHSYCSLTGIVGILLSLYCLVQGILQVAKGETDSMTAVLMLVGVWFIVINPLSMLGKAATQLKTNPSLQKPITYFFNEKGMLQEQGEVKTGCKWSLITKTVFLKRIWILYAGKVRGTILPVTQLGEHQEELKALIKTHTGKKR